MTSKDWITDFKLNQNGENCTVQSLLRAMNQHCGDLAEEYNFSLGLDLNQTSRIPERYWRLIAFAVEGNSEGYYVHVGALLRPESRNALPQYFEFGLAKTYSSESAYKLATEASRFLAAASWN